MKVIQNKLTKSLIILPIFGIIVLSFLYINIYVEGALMNSSAITNGYDLTVQNNTTLSIELPTMTPISVTPTVTGQFSSQTLPVNVISDYVNGYTLTMSASTSSLSRSEAVNGKTYEIPTLASNVDGSNNPYTCTAETSETCNFPKDTWGYKRTTTQVSDDGYRAFAANTNVPINTTSGPANESISNVDFGVKLSNATPNGTYNITLNFLAVTNVAPNLYYMQDATSTSLAAAMPNVGDTTVLYDRRDNKEYTIAKLADGKYWMTKNLDLDGGTPLYSSDSDVPAGYDVEPYYILPQSSETGFDQDGAAYAYVYNSPNKTDSCGSGCYSYYSYNAATAMSGTNISTDNTDAPYSICPAGWRLPTSRTTVALAQGTPGSDFYKMAIHYGLNPANVNENPDSVPTFCSEAGDGGDCGNKTTPNFLRAGNYHSSTFDDRGAYGYYWSSTASGSADARYLLFNSGYVYSADSNYRRNGFSVRCLFDATMQNFTSEDADSLAEFESETLVDSRDGNTYTVKKINGNVWMTQNLRFTGITLTPADSNVASDTNMTYYSLASSDSSYANHCDSTNGYNYACIKDSGSTETGVWYNYVAASAGTITGSSNTTPATSSLCPSGWHIPTGPANSTSSEFYELFQSTSIGNIATNAYLTAFNTAAGGRYIDGTMYNTNYGFLWSATVVDGAGRYSLDYNNDNAQFNNGYYNRHYGYFVRCIAD